MLPDRPIGKKTHWVGHNIEWLPRPNESHFNLGDRSPPYELITAVFCLALDGERFLMTRLVHRGWTIPGGHLESEETPVEAVCREVYEETHVRLGEVWQLGYQRNILKGAKPKGYKYPYPVNYQVFFWGKVMAQEPMISTEEVLERGWFTLAEARRMSWFQTYGALYELVIEVARLE